MDAVEFQTMTEDLIDTIVRNRRGIKHFTEEHPHNSKMVLPSLKYAPGCYEVPRKLVVRLAEALANDEPVELC